ncbi:MAG TPA: rhomboid family intramembrane serine protease [Caulobacteraceae bacterium]
MSQPYDPAPATPREPMFNAPAPVLAVVAAIVAGYAAQSLLASGVDWGLRGGVSGEALRDGRWWSPLTALFIHGGWSHALMNALGALAFGAPVARLLAGRGGGAALFYLFYVVTGLVANLGYAVLNWNSAVPAVGASGAVLGLMGAASRLLFTPPGALWPVFSRIPLSMAAAMAIISFLIWVTGITPGMPGAVVAWEAHLFGYLAGLLLIGPFARLAGR